MSRASHISREPPRRPSQDYAALREAGLERIRQLAADTWTDHNVHDPGITLLEALCFATTELGLRSDLDMADLLRSGEAHAAPELVPAHRVLPSAPVTAEDLRRTLLDHSQVSDAQVTPEADGEVPLRLRLAEGELRYSENGDPVRIQGLFEVLVAFADSELNSNTYTVEMKREDDAGLDEEITVTLDLALPHWDEEPAAELHGGITAPLEMTALDPLTGNVPSTADTPVWLPLGEPFSFFGKLRVAWDGQGQEVRADLPIILRFTGASRGHEPVKLGGALTRRVLDAFYPALESGEVDLVGRFAERVRNAAVAVREIEQHVATRRNLCEQSVRIAAVREQEIAVSARIEVTGGTDLEQLLAEVFLAIDRELSPPPRFHTLEDMLERGRSIEQIFTGPLLRHGFLDPAPAAERTRPEVIYTSDILRLIMQQRGAERSDVVTQENPGGRYIVAVTELRLSNYVNNRIVTAEARDGLRLVEAERYRPRLSPAKSRIQLVRDDVVVDYDRDRVIERFGRARERAREKVEAAAEHPPRIPFPQGEALPVEDYLPFQNDLPPVYGVGAHGVPRGAGPERRARALQLQGYLLLFESFLADFGTQLGHINRFFSAAPGEQQTYFGRSPLDLPGAAQLLEGSPRGEDRDTMLDRRNRMLDHLLARQGEEMVALGQELHRQAHRDLATSGPEPTRLAQRRRAVNDRLVRAKAAFLHALPELDGNRLQAFGQALQPEESSTPLESRIAHWIGMGHHRRQPRLAAIDDFFEVYDEINRVPDGRIEKRWRLWRHPGKTGGVLLSSVFHFASDAEKEATAMARSSIERVLRFGLDPWNYAVTPAGPSTFHFELRDPRGSKLGQHIPSFPSEAEAERAVAETADHLYHHYSYERLHLVEHLLLRPRQKGDTLLQAPRREAGHCLDPYSHRLSLVFPSGFARDFAGGKPSEAAPHRFRDPEFRRHAERMVRRACPAHLLPIVHWVDRYRPSTEAEEPGQAPPLGSFEGFESRYLTWLAELLSPEAPPPNCNEVVEALNEINSGPLS